MLLGGLIITTNIAPKLLILEMQLLFGIDDLHPSFTNIPQFMEEPDQMVPPGVAMEISVDALAAGAAIFGDDFLSGFDFLQS
ncbi:unnamed protein product [Vicia faba]|uniref:Uncharacterized protein n=1 Tax=Vicia faba TaxID=3906 RepID=A0AAV0YV40_VICFA|nr:unnamed protein product [Vicia faba]